jgi:hypothetical protein
VENHLVHLNLAEDMKKDAVIYANMNFPAVFVLKLKIHFKN